VTDLPTSVELLAGGVRVRFNVAQRSHGWVVVGPVHTESEVVPFLEMGDQVWSTREEAIAAVLKRATPALEPRSSGR
jgi:hypothetical protein